MKRNIRIAIAQINCIVGDLRGNSRKIVEYLKTARGLGVDLISFPELSITGYPPEDLLLKNNFVNDNLETLKKLVKSVNDTIVILGFVDKKGKDIYNAAAVLYKGEVKGIYHKMLLPNYGVFDEKRYFKSGDSPVVFRFKDILFGVNICEDIWHKEGPIRLAASQGASLIIKNKPITLYSGRTGRE